MCIASVLTLAASSSYAAWNNPHAGEAKQNTRYGAFVSPPKTLDPARAYSSNEIQFIAQIYEPPLQYHYLKRPFLLIPLTVTQLPTVTYYDAQGKKLPGDVNPERVAYSVYDIHVKPAIYYQPHPALAKKPNGQYRYHQLSINDLKGKYRLRDFNHTGTRELTAADYVYQIKRLASPAVQSPIFGVMSKHIIGLDAYAKQLKKIYRKIIIQEGGYLNLRQHKIEGVTVISRYHYQIKIKGVYPQFIYWLAMPFFAPIPWEADIFYSQPGMRKRNITLDWYPIGTGPYQLTINDPNRQMVLTRNPNFHGEAYPSTGMPGDKPVGYLNDAGKPLPLVDKFVFSLDKESIPRWNKFLQGYYDKSAISADSFDQAIKLDKNGEPVLTDFLKQKGIQLQKTISPAVFYIGFNMSDMVVGGDSERARKLRQAISIALDYEEYISIFMNGRGIAAHGPIPPGIFGYDQKGINHIVYFWGHNKKHQRKPIAVAKQLLIAAGYPGGRNPKTGKPLLLNYDVASSGSPDDKAHWNWMRKQLSKIGIQLNIRSTDYNRFQKKVRTGQAQLFSWGWMADYPDPENFLFLLYGPNSKVKYGGENASNYHNPEFDRLFEQMRSLPNGPKRREIIQKMLALVRRDSPWIWGVHPMSFSLSHAWNRPSKPHAVANNVLKYERVNTALRAAKRQSWNRPIIWPLLLLLGFLLLLGLPLAWSYWRRERRPTVARMEE